MKLFLKILKSIFRKIWQRSVEKSSRKFTILGAKNHDFYAEKFAKIFTIFWGKKSRFLTPKIVDFFTNFWPDFWNIFENFKIDFPNKNPKTLKNNFQKSCKNNFKNRAKNSRFFGAKNRDFSGVKNRKNFTFQTNRNMLTIPVGFCRKKFKILQKIYDFFAGKYFQKFTIFRGKKSRFLGSKIVEFLTSFLKDF